MLKKIFKAMWYGVKSFYKENRGLFQLFGTTVVPIIIGGIMEALFIHNKGLSILLTIILVILVNIITVNYLHYKRAEECAERKILLVLLIIVVLAIIYILRNYIIISNLENISKEYTGKTNYIANVYSIQSNSVNILKSYNKDGEYLTLIETKVNDVNDIRKLTKYKKGNETIAIVQSGNNKIAMLDESVIGEVQVVTFGMLNSESGMNIPQKILFSLMARISTDKINNKQCMYIQMPEGWKLWGDKETGTIVREINGGFVTERYYQFDIVKQEDIVKPDLTDCIIQD